MIHHLHLRHARELPENVSPAKFLFSSTHGGRTGGSCRVCNSETLFDEKIGRPRVFCTNPKCKEAFATIAQSRNIEKYGVPHLLNNQKHQMFMLSKRKISGEYDWSDGRTKIPYVGSYERKFFEFLDNFMDFDPSVIHSPCPFDIQYEFEGEMHTYTPDVYIDIVDLVVEIKHGGDNPNNHHKIQAVDVAKDKAKQEAIKKSTNHNFIKIVDNKFGPFLKAMFKLVEDEKYESKQRLFVINESSQTIAAIREAASSPPLTGIPVAPKADPDSRYNTQVSVNMFTALGGAAKCPSMKETQSLASIHPIVTGFIGREIDGNEKPLYITVFNDSSDNYTIGVAIDRMRDPAIYENSKFITFLGSGDRLDGQDYSVYKYIGNGNYDEKQFLKACYETTEHPYGSDVEAFTTILESVFKRPLYNVGQLLMNPEFVKIKQGRVEY
jgi:hypothetical protein